MSSPETRVPLPSGATGLLTAAAASVRRHRLLEPGDPVLVAVSGGPDSVALLHALVTLRPEWRLRLTVCHVHHGLRPEADRDAELVASLAARLDCPATVVRVAVPAGPGCSPEDAARRARYRALARAADRVGATRIALGHTADDQAETVLMRVLQGAGVRGLAGMPVRRGRLIRPLLDVDRGVVLEHLAAHALAWVEDTTNRDPKFLRNRIRHELLPLLAAQGWPRLPDALRRIGRAARESVDALEALLAPRAAAMVGRGPGGWTLDLAAFSGLPEGAVKVLLQLGIGRIASQHDLPPGLRASHLTALHALLAAPVGARVRLPHGLAVERARRALWVGLRGDAPPAVPLAVPGESLMPSAGLRLHAETVAAVTGRPADAAWEAWFDAAQVPAHLVVRVPRPGDRMTPFGVARPVRVSGVLAAAGAARGARARWPLLVAPKATTHPTTDPTADSMADPLEDEVLWVIGVRRGAAAPVTTETSAMLRIRAILDPPRAQKEEST